MFVDLMNDIHTTFTERFLRAQLVFNAPPPQPPPSSGPDGDGGRRPTRRYDAMGVLEDIPAEEQVAEAPRAAQPQTDDNGASTIQQPAKPAAPVRQDPTVVGAGRARKLSDLESGKGRAIGGGAVGGGTTGAGGSREVDWTNVGRNDPCPCGSGKKYKKCHGA